MDTSRLRKYFRHGMFPQLVAFEACIRHGSVTRAAEELSLAQPTVSCLVKKLSDTLGGPLMSMRDRRIAPTPLGVELVALCHELFDAFDDFDTRRGRDVDGEGGQGGADETDDSAARYDRRAAILESPPWLSPYPQRRLSPSRPRALRCPRAKPRPEETTGES
jgi:regulatory helix-turn-helix LysR family protein